MAIDAFLVDGIWCGGYEPGRMFKKSCEMHHRQRLKRRSYIPLLRIPVMIVVICIPKHVIGRDGWAGYLHPSQACWCLSGC